MTILWVVLAALGALAFLVGVNSADAASVWSIYLVNLVFWSGLAVTGPAIAGMMQLTEAHWSPSVRRIALTTRSEEHTSELQSLTNLVCRLLLEKKKKRSRTTAEQQHSRV